MHNQLADKKKEKEPGIPNGYPFKAEALAALEQMKQNAEHEKEVEKLQRAKFLQAKRQQAIEKQRKVQEELKLRQEKFELRGKALFHTFLPRQNTACACPFSPLFILTKGRSERSMGAAETWLKRLTSSLRYCTV